MDAAAAAVVVGLDPAVPAGVYDVVDDEPLTRRELNAALAEAVGRRRLWGVPGLALRLLAPDVAPMMVASQRVSNQRFKAASDWQPAAPSDIAPERRNRTLES